MRAEYDVEQVTPERLTPLLGDAWRYLLDMSIQSSGKADELDIIRLVGNTTMQLWRVYRIADSKTMAYGLTSIVNYPKLRFLFVEGIAGTRLREWKHLIHKVYAWGREQGCTNVRFVGREGWVRIFADESYTQREVVLERRL